MDGTPNPADIPAKPAPPVTGKDKFEYMVLYCKSSLQNCGQGVCAFYLEDFDDCDELTLRAVQKIIQSAGFVTKDFLDPVSHHYKGFWAWQARK